MNYSATGMREDQIFTLEEYVDGEKLTANAVAYNKPEDGDVSFAGTDIKARRLQFVWKSTCSEFRRVGDRHEIWVKPNQGSRAERQMTGWGYEQLLSGTGLKWHLGRSPSLGYERISKTILSLPGAIAMDGPDGMVNSAYAAIAGSDTITYDLVHPAISGAFTIVMWRGVYPTVQRSGTTIAMATYGTWDAFALVYYTGTNLVANSLRLLIPSSHVGFWFSMRLVANNATATELLSDYFRDVKQHGGRKYEPRF